MLAFNHLLISLRNHPDASRFAPGLGPISLLGGEYDGDRKMDDLKLLFRAYVTNAASSGHMEEPKVAALNQLRNILGLGKQEAEVIVLDVTSKVYRKKLAQSVSRGDQVAAQSKAEFLQNLCDDLHFDPQKVIEIHEEIYRQKLQQAVADGELSEEDVKSLEQLQVMLCIRRETVEAAHRDICGRLLENVVKDAIASGDEGYTPDVKKSVTKAARGLRLTRVVAMSIASDAVQMIFMTYIQRAAAKNCTESAEELRKMIVFNTVIVTDLVADIKGESSDTTSIDPTEEEDRPEEEDKAKEDVGWLPSSSRPLLPHQNTRAPKGLGKTGQKVITLKADLPERARIELYNTYMLFSGAGKLRQWDLVWRSPQRWMTPKMFC